MGYFTRMVFGTDRLPKDVLLFAGMLYPKKEINSILRLFDSSKKLSDFQPVLSYEVKKKNKKYLLCFGAYGGTSALEITNILSEGGVKNIYFFGWAGSNVPVDVGTINIPKKIRCLDGISILDSSKTKYTYPSNKLLETINIKNSFFGTHCTLPGLGVLHGIKSVEKESKKYDTIDTELSVILHFANKNNVDAIGLLIVTDSPKNHKEVINPDVNFSSKTRYKILRNTVLSLIGAETKL